MRLASLLLCRFHCLGEGRDHFHEVADDAVVGDFKDGGLGVLVDGDDALRGLHADQVLDGSGDADGEVELGRDGLAGAADLALHGQPAVIADGARGGQLRAECGGQILHEGHVVQRT